MFYCKEKRGIVFTESDTTISWNDDLLSDYREYANNINNKSYECKFDESGLPIIKRYTLDENGNRYSRYLDTPNDDGIYEPDLVQIDKDILSSKKNELDLLIENHMDSEAKEWGYTVGIDRAITYILTKEEYDSFYAINPNCDEIIWHKEGKMFRAWRLAIWKYIVGQLALIESGQREFPSNEELLLELPKIETYQAQQGL